MKGNGEDKFCRLLENIGYKEDVNFFRQYPFESTYVLDIAFPVEKVAIEIDGESHKDKKQIIKDKERDRLIKYNDWVIIRIPTWKIKDYTGIFYKNLVKETVEERLTKLYGIKREFTEEGMVESV